MMILAYHPAFVLNTDMHDLAKTMKEDFDCEVYLIAHHNMECEPLYCVQFTDTGKKKP